MKSNSFSTYKKLVKPFVLGGIFGMSVTALLLIAFAVAMCLLELPEGIQGVLSTFSLGVGCIVDGYVLGKILRHNGLFKGCQAGLIIFGLCLLISIITGSFCGEMILGKLFVCTICGAMGGVFGVNSKVKI